jgi:iron complex outermembrane receptor protein
MNGKHWFFITIFACCSQLWSQVTIKGKVQDGITGELLENATVTAGSVSVLTDKYGSYTLKVPMGTYQMTAEVEGFSKGVIPLSADRTLIIEVNFDLDNLSDAMQAVQIVANVAKDRKTPVAYTNLTGKDINERLGSQDLPVLLNNTPGVYATQQGGGAGDARITIRGFNQRNIAVMIDGIPVNDMENGWVYWSNWFGLGGVTALTQIQRGLGSSRIANPAVGGTMNIITKGMTRKPEFSVAAELGDSRYQQYSLTASSGRLKGDWGFSLALTHRSSTGYVDGLYDDMWAYFFKAEKQWGKKHNLSFTAVGAPQSHGQRAFKARLSLYDHALAQKLGMDTVLRASGGGEMALDLGRRYNQHRGTYRKPVRWDDFGNVVYEDREVLMNERTNTFHKPQLYFKYDYRPSERWFSNTTAYMSIGTGGGTRGEGINQVPSVYGQFDFQSAVDQNSDFGFISSIDPRYSATEKISNRILSIAVNNHVWYGLLNTTQYKLTKRVTLTGGLDLRTYVGKHYKEVYDLLGGDYYIPQNNLPRNPAKPENHLYRKGDIFHYNNDGLVTWYGGFLETEYTYNQFTGFVNVSTSQQAIQRIDYFNLTPDKQVNYSPVMVFNGATVKAGGNYNITRKMNVFVNLGYLDRPVRFNNVFDTRNGLVQDSRNELVYAIEGGAGYKSRRFTSTLNWYYTDWRNRPVDFRPVFRDADDNPLSYNINGLKARHMGIELQSSLKAGDGITIDLSMHLGDWIWRSGSSAMIRDEAGDSIGFFDFDATGVHVGDAAQNQLAVNIRWEPTLLKGAYISCQYVFFGKQFADFEPIALRGAMKRKESYRIPDYWYANITGGYAFKVNGAQVRVYFMLNNVTNNFYISDAQHRSIASDINNPNSSVYVFNPRNLEVFVSQGFRFTTGLKVSF